MGVLSKCCSLNRIFFKLLETHYGVEIILVHKYYVIQPKACSCFIPQLKRN